MPGAHLPVPMPAVTMWKYRTDLLRDPDFREEVLRFLRFALVGGLGTVTDVGILNLLHKVAGLPLFWANAVGFYCAVAQNFMLHRRFTFPNQERDTAARQLGLFTAISMIGLGLSQLVLLGLHRLALDYWVALLGDPGAGYDVSYNAAKLISIAVVLIWNFTGNRLWTFATPAAKDGARHAHPD
ncbi:MAG: GtrA family protein [Caldilineaceae bacterium SB0662_bin_9]|uniref:GtrA family protein n=1 Tax=Caldilineaceae bacterium SB0662_bin_9 TaxID=2605258 RepID=A0A6B1DP22_9CHLR|nr:GtrA family protein [Caldilineaceae bacterium SB0662_bin_9]